MAEIESLPANQVAKNLLEDVYDWDKVDIVIRWLVECEYRFTDSDLPKLGKRQIEKHYGSLTPPFAFEFAKHGYPFTIAELLKMKESGDKILSLVPFTMVFLAGKVFTVDEIFALGNPTTDEGETIARLMADRGHAFTVKELLSLGNDEALKVAHIMADHGHYLSDFNIKLLTNPKTERSTIIEEEFAKRKSSSHKALPPPPEIIEQFRLVYQDEKPTFEITIHDKTSFGKSIRANWYRYYFHSSTIADYNTFTLELYELDKIWAVRINTLRKTDSYNHLYRKMMVLELAVKLNEVLRNHLEHDFSNHFGNQYVNMGGRLDYEALEVTIC